MQRNKLIPKPGKLHYYTIFKYALNIKDDNQKTDSKTPPILWPRLLNGSSMTAETSACMTELMARESEDGQGKGGSSSLKIFAIVEDCR